MKLFVAAAISALAVTPVSAGTLTSIFDSFYVLGDSLADYENTTRMVGEIALQQPDPASLPFDAAEPLAQPGVSSDGFTWAKEYVDEFGDSGVNLSYRSARATTNDDGPPDLAAQINGGPTFDTSFTFNENEPDQFTISGTATRYADGGGGLTSRLVDPTERELVAIVIGGNDFLDTSRDLIIQTLVAFETGTAAPTEAEIQAALGALVSTTLTSVMTGINTIVAAGVEDLVVANLPDFSVIPQFTADRGDPLANALFQGIGDALGAAAAQYNALLSLQLQALEAGKAVNITEVDIFNLLTDFELISSAGITNPTDACTTAGVTSCEDFFYFDGIHPTAAGHALVGDLIFEGLSETYVELQPVPLPAPALMLITAFGGFAALRRRKRAA